MSEGWKESICLNKLSEYKKNAKDGLMPTSLKEERLMKLEEKIIKDKVKERKERNKISLGDFFNDFYYPQIQKEKKLKTYQREESLFRNWIYKNIGNLSFNKITKTNIENIFYDVVDSGKSIRTAEYALTTLKQIWREAKENHFAPAMPVISKSLKKKINQNNNARIRFLSHSEAETLLEELKIRSINLYEKAMISTHGGLCNLNMIHS